MEENRINLDEPVGEEKHTSGPADEAKKTPEKMEERSENEEDQLGFYLETIENLRRERDEYYDLLLRKQADFENFKKRTTKEKEELRLSTQGEILQQLLTILDAFEKGLSTLETDSENAALETYREGYELILREFQSILGKFGVSAIPGAGERFDPNVHEAVVREVTSEHEEGEILDEYRKGYMIKDRLLRPAQVKVAAEPTDSASAGEVESGETGE